MDTLSKVGQLLFPALALWLSSGPTQARPVPVPDSLRQPLQAARTEHQQLVMMLRIASAYNVGLDSAGVMHYAQAAARLARQLGDSIALGQAINAQGFLYLQQADQHRARPLLLRAESLLRGGPLAARAENSFHLGWLYGDTNQLPKALRYLRRAYAGFGQLRNAAQQAEVLNTLCVVHMYNGRADSAAVVLLQAARIQHRLGLDHAEATTLGNLATVLHQQGQLAEADRYARQALATLQRLGDETSQPAVYQTLGNIAWARHRPAEALPYYRACARLLLRQHLEGNLTSCYGSMAGALSDLGRADSAIYYQLRAVQLTQQLGQDSQTSIEMAALAQIFLRQNKLAEAARWARASVAKQGGQLLQTSRPLTILMRVAERQGNYQEALRLAQQIQQVEEARKARENEQHTNELRVAYETEKAEQQVRLLTQQNRLQAQQQELARLREQRQLAGGGALGVLLLGGLGAGIGGYRRRQRAREQRLRRQIAADLHDDVGSLLTQISLQSELLSQG
ncbi:tetratricopeptide repeat protein, partial [Hymenobacter saemangeumensis]|uniref:tetratricopeptide repeat protein n=1 Tax=Hymenobacter saemangeumensis TaxID=1084522 RepID=UPI0031EAC996